MPSNSYDAPAAFARSVRQAAPLKTLGEDWGRRGGFYGDSDECVRAYRTVLVYLERGTGGNLPLLKAIVAFIDKVQPSNVRYAVLPLAFDGDGELQHDGKPLYIQGRFKVSAGRKTIETCERIAGGESGPTSEIVQLFPRTAIRSLYSGKTRVDGNDLLIFAASGDGQQFEQGAAREIRKFRKHVVFVTIGDDGASWTSPRSDFGLAHEPDIDAP